MIAFNILCFSVSCFFFPPLWLALMLHVKQLCYGDCIACRILGFLPNIVQVFVFWGVPPGCEVVPLEERALSLSQ